MNVLLLVEAAARMVVLAALVWAAMKLIRVHSAPARKTVWLIVLAGAFLMPLLCWWNPIRFTAPLEAPVLSRAMTVQSQSVPNLAAAPGHLGLVSQPPLRAPVARRSGWSLERVLSLVYLGVVALLLIRMIVGLVFAFQLKRRSTISADLSSSCDVRISPSLSSPVTIASSILLPASSASWDRRKFDVVLAHETCHVRGKDFYWQLAARLHTCLFWFSPLPWWLEREIADINEAASDEAGRTCAASASWYAELLLEFAGGTQSLAATVPMARTSNIRRRIERILSERHTLTSQTTRRQIAFAAFLLPLALLAASTSIELKAADPVAFGQVPPAPSAPAAPAAQAEPDPVVPAAPAVPSRPSKSSAPQSFTYRNHSADNPYVIVSGDSVTMSGSGDDLSEARRAKSSGHGDYMWFVKDGKSYIIDDPALVRQSKDYFKPQEELGRRQALLGEQQAKLGEEQARLGELQSKVLVDPPKMDKELAELVANAKQLASVAKKIDTEQLAKLQSQLAELQAKLGAAQALAGEEQGKLGEKQGKLGEQQGKLGEQQGVLGEQQSRLAEEASRKMQRLFEDALQNGKARQVH